MITWRRSSYSGHGGTGGQECVEVARIPGERSARIALRDSKAPGAGRLVVSPESFADLLVRIKRNRHDLA
jgi:hypothetical protein